MLPSLSRQKACTPCVRSKRKCDRGLPRCQRCVARQIDCEYVGRTFDQIQRSDGLHETDGLEFVCPAVNLIAEHTAADSQLSHTYSVLPMTFLSPTADDTFFDVSNHPVNFNVPIVGSEELLRSSAIDSIAAQQTLDGIAPPVRHVLSRSSIEFAARQLAALPKGFAEQGHTMFVHRVLFQDRAPMALQDAWSACALYCLKNSNNKKLVFCTLEDKIRRLINGITPHIASTVDLLAATQALLLYQIIRLFDGDIRLRAQAELDHSILFSWVGYLREHMSQVGTPISVPAQSSANLISRSGWEHWLIEESIRRTIITAFMLNGVYASLRFGCERDEVMRFTFTAQAALWNTNSEVGWRRACSEKEHLETHITDWDEVMAKAKPEDLEEMGVLVMAMLRGTESTETWLGRKYASRYGFENLISTVT